MSKTGTTASFVYNSDGLRVRKTVNNVVTDYTLHGKNIVHLTQGSDSLHFWYDASGKPAMVEWNDGTTTAKYAYIHNLQGDIVGIVDSNGTEVVKYTYDAWGKVLSTTGSLASTLGTVQPFRYRGYVYDAETGLYYLRSRYYTPVWNRFIIADIITRGNVYCYCNNLPVSQKDPNGFSSIYDDYEEDVSFDGTCCNDATNYVPESTNPNIIMRKGQFYIIRPKGRSIGVYDHEELVATAYRINQSDPNEIMQYIGMYDGYGFYLYCDNAKGYNDDASKWEVINYSNYSHYMLGPKAISYNPDHHHNPCKFVENLQKRLNELGLLSYDQITGVLNQATNDAIIRFQEIYTPTCVDGIVGDETKDKLFYSDTVW